MFEKKIQIDEERLRIYKEQYPSHCDVIEIVLRLNLTSREIYQAMNIINASDTEKRTFLQLPPNMRLGWLKFEMEADH
jgi:hypothetical protein